MTHVVQTVQISRHILFFKEQMTSLTSLPARAEFDTRQMDNIPCTGILLTATRGFKAILEKQIKRQLSKSFSPSYLPPS